MTSILNQKSFIQLLERAKGDLEIRNYNISEDIRVDQTNYFTKVNKIIIEDCIFKGSLELLNITFNNTLIIKNVKIAKALVFSDCVSLYKGDPSRIPLDFHPIKVLESEIVWCINILSCQFDGVIKFNKCLLGSLNFYDLTKTIVIDIDNCTINNHIDFEFSKVEDFNIIQSKIENIRKFDQSIINSLFIENSEVNEILLKSTTIKQIELQNSKVISNYNFRFIKCENLKINDCLINSLFIDYHGPNDYIDEEFMHSFISGINIEGNSSINAFRISGDYNEKCKMTGFVIRFTSQMSGVFEISDCIIGTINFFGRNFKCDVLISNVLCRYIGFHGFLNYSTITLNNINTIENEDNCFTLLNSRLNGVSFINCDLNKFNRFWIENTNFFGIHFSNTNLIEPSKIQMSEVINPHLQKREILMHIKMELKRQGDEFQSLVFRKYELEELNLHYKQTGKLSFDRFIIWVEKLNDFGNDWVKPLKYIFYLSIPFYLIFLLTFKTSFIGRFKFLAIVQGLFQNFKILPIIINPAHSINFSDLIGVSYLPTFWTYFFDILIRIVISILLYQSIKAFRKYSR